MAGEIAEARRLIQTSQDLAGHGKMSVQYPIALKQGTDHPITCGVSELTEIRCQNRMEFANMFLCMVENDGIVPAVGKSGLILDDLGLEIIDHPVARSKMGGPDDIAQEIAAVVNRCQPADIHVQLQAQAFGEKLPDS